MKWHFLTFGGGSWQNQRAAKRLARQAEKTEIFYSCQAMTEKSLLKNYPEFWESNKAFINENPQGFGLWKWKPFIISRKLKELNYEDGLLYLDAGCQFNLKTNKAKQRLEELFTLARLNSGVFFQLPNHEFNSFQFAEYKWSKPRIFEEISTDLSIQKSGQIQGGLLFLIKNDKTLNLIDMWNYYAELENSILLRNPKLDETLPIDFVAHRNDQSILSVLLKQNEFVTIPEETFWEPDWNKIGKDFPIWALRNKTGITRFEFNFREIPDWSVKIILFAVQGILSKLKLIKFKSE